MYLGYPVWNTGSCPGQANLGVLKDDMVNVVVHGHEPTFSQMIVAATQDPEIIEYAGSRSQRRQPVGHLLHRE
jgi:hypothetical protein